MLDGLCDRLAGFQAEAQRKLASAIVLEKARCASELDAALAAESLALIEQDRVSTRVLAVQRSLMALQTQQARSLAEQQMLLQKAGQEAVDGRQALREADEATRAREAAEDELTAAVAEHDECMAAYAAAQQGHRQQLDLAESRLDAARRLLREEQGRGPPEDVSSAIQREIQAEIDEQDALRAAIVEAEEQKAAAGSALATAKIALERDAGIHNAAATRYG